MSKEVTLYCQETPSLKLGPGSTGDTGQSVPGQVIVFAHGFATFDEGEFPDWERWVDAPGTPTIRVVDAASGEATEAEGAVTCPVCGKAFKSDFALNSHLRSHAPKKAKQ